MTISHTQYSPSSNLLQLIIILLFVLKFFSHFTSTLSMKINLKILTICKFKRIKMPSLFHIYECHFWFCIDLFFSLIYLYLFILLEVDIQRKLSTSEILRIRSNSSYFFMNFSECLHKKPGRKNILNRYFYYFPSRKIIIQFGNIL